MAKYFNICKCFVNYYHLFDTTLNVLRSGFELRKGSNAVRVLQASFSTKKA